MIGTATAPNAIEADLAALLRSAVNFPRTERNPHRRPFGLVLSHLSFRRRLPAGEDGFAIEGVGGGLG